MKLKYEFVVKNVCGSMVAVAVGDGTSAFNGMIKLNSTGAEIMEMLAVPTAEDQIVDALTEKYKADRGGRSRRRFYRYTARKRCD